MKTHAKDIPVLILAGGLGTRLRSEVSDVPKVLAPIEEKAFLDYVLENLFKYGFQDIILSVGYLKEKIYDHVAAKKLPPHVQVSFSEEESPLGTGGAMKKALQSLPGEMGLVLNGDTFFPIDYNQLIANHVRHNADISIALREVPNASQSGAVSVDKENRILYFNEKAKNMKRGLINGGIYLCRKDIFTSFNLPETFSIEKDFFEKEIQNIRAHGFGFSDFFIDIGTPETYAQAKTYFQKFVKLNKDREDA